MKEFYLILIVLFAANSAISQWTSQNTLHQGNLLTSVHFTDVNTGYVVGNRGTILKTINAGTTWTDLSIGTSYDLYSVYFTDANTGYAVGSDINSSSGVILKTFNGGITWTISLIGSTNILWSICFTGSNTAYAVGDNLTIVKTTDRGASWTDLSLKGRGHLLSVYFVDAFIGYVAGFGPTGLGILLKTSDGGITWNDLSGGSLNPLYSVYFSDVNTGFAVGGNLWDRPPFNLIIKTTNKGETWTVKRSSSANFCLKSVYFTDADTGYAVGDFGVILKTSNGGTDWKIQDSVTANNLTSVWFSDAKTGYVVGDHGTILKTRNGGSLGFNNQLGKSSSLKIYPNPSSEKIAIETSVNSINSELTIWNINGEQLLTRKFNDSSTEINISTLPGGVYWVKVSGEKGIQVGKFIKQ